MPFDDHSVNPRHMGELQAPDGLGRATIACGDSMQIGLQVVDGRILEARFMTDGLPEAETHCATLAVTALRRAVLDCLALQREPWKKPYRQAGPFEPGRRA
jgi:NifU-like protein involved in Fe-S cluster formation